MGAAHEAVSGHASLVQSDLKQSPNSEAQNPAIEYYDFVAHGMQRCDQREMERVPWRKIAGFLEALECEHSIEGLAARIFDGLPQLFDFDYAFFFVSDARDIARHVRYFSQRQAQESLLQEYLGHYFVHDPVARIIPTFKIGYADWTKYQENEWTREFMPRTGTTHTIGISDLVETGGMGMVLILNRGGESESSEEDLLKMAALYPHLHNLSSAIISPVEHRARELGRFFQAAGLTPREREVAVLLSERLSVGEIADRLFISKKTAAKHLEHIYLKLGLHGKRHVIEGLGQGAPGSVALSVNDVRA